MTEMMVGFSLHTHWLPFLCGTPEIQKGKPAPGFNKPALWKVTVQWKDNTGLFWDGGMPRWLQGFLEDLSSRTGRAKQE
jgi:hypothetical protein